MNLRRLKLVILVLDYTHFRGTLENFNQSILINAFERTYYNKAQYLVLKLFTVNVAFFNFSESSQVLEKVKASKERVNLNVPAVRIYTCTL